MIRYEHPLNERVRTLMRLEGLYARALFFTGETTPAAHHAALLALFEITDVAAFRAASGCLNCQLDCSVFAANRCMAAATGEAEIAVRAG